MDWGSKGIGSFTAVTFSEVHSAIDPAGLQVGRHPFVVCVVGASRDIGRGISTSYAKAGATGLVLASRAVESLEDTVSACKAINPSIETAAVACDITDAAAVASLAEQTKQRFGRVDVVAINSGYSGMCLTNILDVEPASYQQAVNVNYVGTFHLARSFIPLLLESVDGAKTFISVGSIAALIVRGPIANAQYCVSKLAQLKLLEHVHEEFHERGLKTFSVHPGAVDSAMARDTAPKELLHGFLWDSPELCGAFCTWLTAPETDRGWLCGRLLDAKWDPAELERRKNEIVSKDLLKTKLAL
ncbi:NAD(P)-binding protein [Thozetella sp. PMI_491]|nr:NAD(P)-binding protein [Thozetella sp. PMI_491]